LIEQEFDPFTVMLLIMLRGRIVPFVKVVLLNWNPVETETCVPPCAAANRDSANSEAISKPSRIFIDRSFLTSKPQGLYTGFGLWRVA
jgi:hypothetical protein